MDSLQKTTEEKGFPKGAYHGRENGKVYLGFFSSHITRLYLYKIVVVGSASMRSLGSVRGKTEVSKLLLHPEGMAGNLFIWTLICVHTYVHIHVCGIVFKLQMIL